MTTQEVKRKLTAILSADVKGYSRLMGEDEEATTRTLNTYRELMTGLIQHHHGRVVDATGDNLLAEFGSVVDAVRCAAEVQKELKTRNEDLPENRRMEFRIGINLGDVIEEEGRLFGDGVNIAARLESLSDAGGICISGTAFDHVKNKLNLGYKDLGEQTVKNIPEPVRVYRVLTEPGAAGKVIGEKKGKARQWQRAAFVVVAILVVVAACVAIWRFYIGPAAQLEVASKEKMAFPFPDKPSIAVLPFSNMSGDPKKDYLSDGLAEEIINALTRLPQVFVIARNSTFTYKGKAVDVKQVSREMGVKYVMEGSVQWSDGRVRITAQLVDATTGHHIFSERYDRELKDLFALQDDITLKVLTAMQVKFSEGEQARMWAKGTKNLEAYLKLLQAVEHRQVFNKESQVLALQLAEEALALDPGYALAYSTAAMAIALQVLLGVFESPQEVLSRAWGLAQKAVSLDDSLAQAHVTLGFLYVLYKRDHEKGIAEAERAVTLEPNSRDAYMQLATQLVWAGRAEESIPLFKKAIRLSPISTWVCLNNVASAYRNIGQYDEAIAIWKGILERQPDQVLCRILLAGTLVLAGRKNEARAEAAEVMRQDPEFSLERFGKTFPWKNKDDIERLIIEPARKAGLK
jgi:adenylate cyclase